MPRPTSIERTAMAQAIRQFRTALGNTQQQFAERTGLAVTSIARYETNSPPSRDVLEKFAALARESELPFFVDIFEKKAEPEEHVNWQQFLASTSLLHLAAKRISPQSLRQARLALASLLVTKEELGKIESTLSRELAAVDDLTNEIAGGILRSRNVEVEKTYRAFIQEPSLEKATHFIRAAVDYAPKVAERKIREITALAAPELIMREVESLRMQAEASRASGFHVHDWEAHTHLTDFLRQVRGKKPFFHKDTEVSSQNQQNAEPQSDPSASEGDKDSRAALAVPASRP